MQRSTGNKPHQVPLLVRTATYQSGVASLFLQSFLAFRCKGPVSDLVREAPKFAEHHSDAVLCGVPCLRIRYSTSLQMVMLAEALWAGQSLPHPQISLYTYDVEMQMLLSERRWTLRGNGTVVPPYLQFSFPWFQFLTLRQVRKPVILPMDGQKVSKSPTLRHSARRVRLTSSPHVGIFSAISTRRRVSTA